MEQDQPQPQEHPQPPEKQYSQKELDAIITAREKKTAEAQRLADEQAAQQRGEFEKLSEQRARRIEQLEQELAGVATVKEQLEALNATLSVQIKERTKKLPKEFQALIPNGSPAEQFAVLDKVEAAYNTSIVAATPGTPRGGQVSDVVSLAPSDIIDKKRQSYPRL